MSPEDIARSLLGPDAPPEAIQALVAKIAQGDLRGGLAHLQGGAPLTKGAATDDLGMTNTGSIQPYTPDPDREHFDRPLGGDTRGEQKAYGQQGMIDALGLASMFTPSPGAAMSRAKFSDAMFAEPGFAAAPEFGARQAAQAMPRQPTRAWSTGHDINSPVLGRETLANMGSAEEIAAMLGRPLPESPPAGRIPRPLSSNRTQIGTVNQRAPSTPVQQQPMGLLGEGGGGVMMQAGPGGMRGGQAGGMPMGGPGPIDPEVIMPTNTSGVAGLLDSPVIDASFSAARPGAGRARGFGPQAQAPAESAAAGGINSDVLLSIAKALGLGSLGGMTEVYQGAPPAQPAFDGPTLALKAMENDNVSRLDASLKPKPSAPMRRPMARPETMGPPPDGFTGPPRHHPFALGASGNFGRDEWSAAQAAQPDPGRVAGANPQSFAKQTAIAPSGRSVFGPGRQQSPGSYASQLEESERRLEEERKRRAKANAQKPLSNYSDLADVIGGGHGGGLPRL